jgi:RNA polymerase sigma factor (TIGR02999 family)
VSDDVTLILQQIESGDPRAQDRLLELVYGELRRLAAAKLSREYAAQTLQPTALVHEAWLRLGGDAQPAWENRAHFFGAAAEAMRRILIDRARKRQAVRHGGGLQRVDLDGTGMEVAGPGGDDELLAVSEALERLAAEHPRKAQLVKLRYFAGLTIEQAAATLGVSAPTAKRDWAFARAWLYQAIKA